ncbi:chromosome partitioning protein [Promicromonospora citrea]|uniref:non-specific protein-tyrosine kinase n=1 Tax=Promicromonospora citrea TaxID=43677 RepID=A0A8H9GF60_9MICO|nr:chromosome partitioning protein [Promicromonospora citrea]
MNVTEYLRIIRKQWVPVTVLAIAGIVLAAGFALTRTPAYTTSSQIFVSFHGAESTSELATGTTYVQRRVVSYANLVRSPQVLQSVVEELGLDTTPGELASRVQAAPVTDTVLIDITVTDDDPTLAARIANTVAESLAVRVDELETPQQVGDSPVQLQLVREAVPPGSASYPNVPVMILVGLLLGAAAGVAVAVLRELVDTRVRSEEDLSAVTDAAVIGTISLDDEAKEHPLVVQASPYHTRSEAFRRLRTNLQFLDLDGGPQAIVVTSSVPDEGKTTTAINLAITLADADAKVLLVDADLRRPSVAGYLGIEGSVGLTTLLIQRATVDEVAQPWGSAGLYVIPSGAVPPNPAELVGSRAMATLIRETSEQYDYVVIDTPPLLPVTDAALIAKMTSGALMVAGAGQVRREQLRHSLANLSAVSARVLGVVLNKAGREADAYSAGYYDYRPHAEDDGEPKGRRGLVGRRRRASDRRGPSHAAAPAVGGDRPRWFGVGGGTGDAAGASRPTDVPAGSATGTDGGAVAAGRAGAGRIRFPRLTPLRQTPPVADTPARTAQPTPVTSTDTADPVDSTDQGPARHHTAEPSTSRR